MKKSTKGLVAAGAATVLLMGGAGTLAYWTADTDVDAGDLEAGSISLESLACDGFVHSDGSPVTLIVPGDVVTNDCDVTLVLEGDNIGADLTIDPASIPAGPLGDELDPEVELQDSTGAVIDEVEGEGTYTLTAQVTVTFPYGGPVTDPPQTGADNDSQNGTAVLDALELIAVQTNTLN